MKYYTVSLNNNDCVNKSRIKNVKLIQSVSDEETYENVEILAYESGMFVDNHMYDVITHKELFFGDNVKGLSYSQRTLINEDTLKNILNKYNNLTNEELIRYKEGLNEIERISISKYNELNTIAN